MTPLVPPRVARPPCLALALLALLSIPLRGQDSSHPTDAASVLPGKAALFFEWRHPSRTFERFRGGKLWALMEPELDEEGRALLEELAGLEVTSLGLAWEPGAFLRGPRTWVALRLPAAEQRRKLLEDERLAPLGPTERGEWVLLSSGPGARRVLREVTRTSAPSFEDVATQQERWPRWGQRPIRGLVHLDRIRPPQAALTVLSGPGEVFAAGPLLWAAAHADTLRIEGAIDGGITLALRAPCPPPIGKTAYTRASASGPPAPRLAAGDLLHLRLHRDLATLWRDREAVFPESARPGLAELQGNIATFSGGLPLEELAAAFGCRWDLFLRTATDDPEGPDPSFPSAALVGVLREPEPLDLELQLAFQTALGLVNVGQAQEGKPRFLQGSRRVEGIRILTAWYPPRLLPVARDTRAQLQPSLAICEGRVLLGTHPDLVADLVRRLRGGETEALPPLDRLRLQGAELAAQLALLGPFLRGRMILDDGLTAEQAKERFSVLSHLAKHLEHLELSGGHSDGEARLDLRLEAPAWFGPRLAGEER